MKMIRATLIGAVILVVGAAGAQEAPAEEVPISVLIESRDPAIDASTLRAALSETLARPVMAVAEDPLLTILGTVGPEGAASVQIIGARTETFVVPRGNPGWLLRWLRQELVRRVPPVPPVHPQMLVGVECAGGLTPPIEAPGHEIEAREPVRTTGWLNLLSVPPATVTMSGDRIGMTPLVGYEMPPGTHQLVLTTADGAFQAIDVTIEPGQRTLRALSIR
jgi:hypothetical protein